MNTHTNAPNVNEAQRRWDSAQALASARIEGHVPAPEFMADCEAVNAGTMTLDALRAASLVRALAADKAAAGVGGPNGA